MKIYSYVVVRDYGFAPNPFYGYCTIATCKPILRRMANVGDWVIGTGSRQLGQNDNIVFAMCVTEVMNYNEYWKNPRFQNKKPYLIGSKKQAFGDNIYFKGGKDNVWYQENSHHSYSDGSSNEYNISNDTQTDRVLISSDYLYWGGVGPKINPELSSTLCKPGPGYKCNFTADFNAAVIAWVRSFDECGYLGSPLDWNRSA